MIERDAETSRSQLPCQPPPPEPQRVLPAAEWVWREKRRFPRNNQELFAAQFVLGQKPDKSGMDAATSQLEIEREGCLATRAEQSCTQGVTQREIIARDTAFQSRLRGWLLSK